MGAGGGGGHPRGEGRKDGGKESGPRGPAWVCRDHPGYRAASTPPASALRGASWAPRRPSQTAAHTLGTWPPAGPVPPRPRLEAHQRAWEQEAEGVPWPTAWCPSLDIPSPRPRC